MQSLARLAAGLALLSTALSGPLLTRQSGLWPDPEPCEGNCTAVHDPSILRDPSGTWWRFNTNGNIGIASAPEITGPWTYLGSMMSSGSSIKLTSDQQLWAPDVSLIDGTYYAYYAVSSLGSQNSDIGVCTATDPSPGSWTDQGSIKIAMSTDYNKIDPNFFRQNDTSTPLLTFGSAWGGVYQTQLDGDLVSCPDGDATVNVAHNDTATPAIVEGSFQFWWPVDGVDYYYLFFSSGACCDTPPNLPPPGGEYKILVCRASDPAGEFVDMEGNSCVSGNGGSLVLGSHDSIYAPGGQGVYAHESLPFPVLYYHYVNTAIGYDYSDFQFGFNYVDFSSGWPVVTTSS